MRVGGQVPGVQTPGLGAAKVCPIKQDFPERKQLSLIYHSVLWMCCGVLDLPLTAHARLSMRGSPAGTVQITGWFFQELQHSIPTGDGRTPPCCREQVRGQQSPLAAGVLLPGKGWTGLFWLVQQQCLLFLTPGCSAVAPLAPAPVWVTSRLCCTEGKLQAQVSRQQEQWRGVKGKRVWGGGWRRASWV